MGVPPLARGRRRPHAAFIIATLGLQFGVFLWYCAVGVSQVRDKASREGSDQVDAMLGRVRTGFPRATLKRIASGFFQKAMESAASDNFPLRERLVQRYAQGRRATNRLACLAFPGDWVPYAVLPNRIVILPNQDRLADLPLPYRQADIGAIDSQAHRYRAWAAENPRVRFWVFADLSAGDWYALSDPCPRNVRTHLAGDRYLRRLRQSLGAEIPCAWAGEGQGPVAGMELHYRSDHHWSMRGTYAAYRELHRLMATRNPNLGPPVAVLRWHQVPGVTFLGSHARRGGGCNDYPDVLEGVDFAAGPLAMSIPCTNLDARNMRGKYFHGSASMDTYANHYNDYFGRDYGWVRYSSADARGGRLLALGDSMKNAMEPLIASHFAHTHFVDLRHFRSQVGRDFHLSAFIQDNSISDVLLIGSQSWILGLSELKEPE
jgi:hypothetical protein